MFTLNINKQVALALLQLKHTCTNNYSQNLYQEVTFETKKNCSYTNSCILKGSINMKFSMIGQ